MEFRNAMTILFSHIGYVFKIMVWIIISLIITSAVGVAILIPLWKVFVATTDVAVLGQNLLATVTSVWNGSINFRVAIYDIVPQILDVLRALASNTGATVGLVFTLIFLYAIYSFVMGLSYYTIGDIINKLMASNLRFGFASNMALNFKKCCRYSVARLLVTLPIDIVCIALGLLIAYGLFTVIKVFAFPVMLVLAVLFCSLRSLLFSGWLPRVLHHPEERIYTSFSRAFTFVKANLGGLFKAYFVTFSCVYLLSAVLTMPTGGIILLVLPSIYYFLLRAVELVGYYKTKGYSFYVDGSTVINTVEYGFRASSKECSLCADGDCANCVKKNDSQEGKNVEERAEQSATENIADSSIDKTMLSEENCDITDFQDSDTDSQIME